MVKLKRTDFVQDHFIIAPRWSTGDVLIATFKVAEHNVIHFTSAPTLPGSYYLDGKTIRKYNVEEMKTKAGGKIRVYAVPKDELIVYEGRIPKPVLQDK